MKFEIKKQVKSELFHREEFELEVVAPSNPKREEVLAFLKKDPELCVIKEIQGNFGRDVFNVIVFVYNTLEAKEQTEYIPRKIKKKLDGEKKKATEEAAKVKETKVEEVKAE